MSSGTSGSSLGQNGSGGRRKMCAWHLKQAHVQGFLSLYLCGRCIARSILAQTTGCPRSGLLTPSRPVRACPQMRIWVWLSPKSTLPLCTGPGQGGGASQTPADDLAEVWGGCDLDSVSSPASLSPHDPSLPPGGDVAGRRHRQGLPQWETPDWSSAGSCQARLPHPGGLASPSNQAQAHPLNGAPRMDGHQDLEASSGTLRRLRGTYMGSATQNQCPGVVDHGNGQTSQCGEGVSECEALVSPTSPSSS